MAIERTPPQNMDAERSVLGAVLLNNEVLQEPGGRKRPQFAEGMGRRRAVGMWVLDPCGRHATFQLPVQPPGLEPHDACDLAHAALAAQEGLRGLGVALAGAVEGCQAHQLVGVQGMSQEVA